VDGGGLSLEDSTVTLENVRFENNFADDDGGGLYTDNCVVSISGCEFSGNTCDGSGAGLLAVGGSLTMAGSTFGMNQAFDLSGDGDAGWGGAMYLVGLSQSFLVEGCSFHMNSATRGGVARLSDVIGTFQSCTFTDNTATEGFGGVFYANTAGTISIDDSHVEGNHAANEGGRSARPGRP